MMYFTKKYLSLLFKIEKCNYKKEKIVFKYINEDFRIDKNS
jgi:hypothetical protein